MSLDETQTSFQNTALQSTIRRTSDTPAPKFTLLAQLKVIIKQKQKHTSPFVHRFTVYFWQYIYICIYIAYHLFATYHILFIYIIVDISPVPNSFGNSQFSLSFQLRIVTGGFGTVLHSCGAISQSTLSVISHMDFTSQINVKKKKSFILYLLILYLTE